MQILTNYILALCWEAWSCMEMKSLFSDMSWGKTDKKSIAADLTTSRCYPCVQFQFILPHSFTVGWMSFSINFGQNLCEQNWGLVKKNPALRSSSIPRVGQYVSHYDFLKSYILNDLLWFHTWVSHYLVFVVSLAQTQYYWRPAVKSLSVRMRLCCFKKCFCFGAVSIWNTCYSCEPLLVSQPQ